ncbi:hypothetical protein Aduo_011968 [Ancylostoma duodenale]
MADTQGGSRINQETGNIIENIPSCISHISTKYNLPSKTMMVDIEMNKEAMTEERRKKKEKEKELELMNPNSPNQSPAASVRNVPNQSGDTIVSGTIRSEKNATPSTTSGGK